MSDLVPLVGEPLALDLVNTRTAAGDLLATAGQLRAWVRLQAGRLPDDAVPDDLDAVRDVRAHTAAALERVRLGRRPDERDLAGLNDAQRAAPAISEATWDGTGVRVERRRAAPGVAAWLAEAAAELLADPAVTKVRQCEADGCVLLFLPAHPRRRWCSAARCGNRVRVARHYRKTHGDD